MVVVVVVVVAAVVSSTTVVAVAIVPSGVGTFVKRQLLKKTQYVRLQEC